MAIKKQFISILQSNIVMANSPFFLTYSKQQLNMILYKSGFMGLEWFIYNKV
jgi:hypothetical protein